MKHRFARRVQRTLALTLTLCIAFQSLLSVFAPSPVARAATAAAIDAGPVRVRYYYASDDATAQAVQDLLAGAGFTVETVRLGAPPQQNFSLHLPIITRGGGAAATTRASAATGWTRPTWSSSAQTPARAGRGIPRPASSSRSATRGCRLWGWARAATPSLAGWVWPSATPTARR
jgi:hypothetical protein